MSLFKPFTFPLVKMTGTEMFCENQNIKIDSIIIAFAQLLNEGG